MDRMYRPQKRHLRPHPPVLPARPRPADRRAGREAGPDGPRHRLRHRPQPRPDRPALPGGAPVRPGRGRADAGDRGGEAVARGVGRELWPAAIAEELDPEALFGHRGGFDHVTISYCLSMVDDPERAVRAASALLGPGRHAARGRFRRHGRSARLVPARDGGVAGAVPRASSAGGGGHAVGAGRGGVEMETRNRSRCGCTG